MKILHIITNTELGGAQKVCIDLCRSAVADGDEVAVTSMSEGFLWSQLPPEVKQYQLKNMVKPIKPKYDIKVLRELRKVRKDFKPDIIQLHSSKAGVLGRIIGLGSSSKVVYTVHGFDSIRLMHRVFIPLERVLQYCCKGIVGVSDYDKNNLLSEKITHNVVTIYNGISETSIKKENAFPVEISGIKDKKIILTIARIAPPKNLKLFLETASKFTNENYLFIWIGGSPEYTIEDIKKMYDVPSNVILLGDVSEASRYINLCDLFVLFSDFEGLPMTIIEAMSQKKAIVASDVGGIHELVDNSNGALINNSIDDSESAIRKIMADDELRNKLGLKSYEKFQEKFTLEKMWKSYKDLYLDILK